MIDPDSASEPTPEKPPVTMQAIADAVGVSRMTVSRALRNDPRISEKRRREIHETAARLGYRANPLVSALMAQLRSVEPPEGSTLIAIVNGGGCRLTDLPKNHPEYLATRHRYFLGAVERCRQLGYRAEEFLVSNPEGDASLPRILRARGIRSILFLPFPRLVDLRGWALESFAMAVVGYSIVEPPLHMALTDQFHNVEAVMRTLREEGYRRIGLALHQTENPRISDQWRGAYATQQDRLAQAERVPLLFLESLETGPSREQTKRWLNDEGPEAVIYVSEHVLDHLVNRGLSVPAISLDRPRADPEVPGINQRQEEVAANAVDLIIGQLHRNEYGPPAVHKTVLTSGIWEGTAPPARLR
jgi:DNA-binding LacI/PurR family transcriptional regulator